MSGVYENKNAEKWTLEVTREFAAKALATISEDCYFLSDVAEKCGTYRQVFEYLANKFNDDEMVFNTLKRLHNKCESIVMKKTAENKINTALGIFVLKSYHGLMETSKQHVDHTTGGDKINIPVIKWVE